MLKKKFCCIMLLLFIAECGVRESSWSAFAQKSTRFEHKVEQGETVYSIARKYGVTTSDIYKLNPGSQQTIKAGQILIILHTPKKESSKVTPQTHTIQKGETLYGVAHKYKVKEQDLQKSNPGLSAETFSVGKTIVIPSSQSVPSNTQKKARKEEGIQVALILPVGNNGPARYVEFYEGLLLSILDLKKEGISVNLDVLAATTSAEVKELIHSSKLKNKQIVIGGETEESVDALASYAALSGQVYVSPFIWQAGKAYEYENFYQINPPKQILVDFVADAFCREYERYEVLFVDMPSPNHKAIQAAIEDKCKEQGIVIHHRSMSDLSAQNWPKSGTRPFILVPNSSNTNELKKLCEYLEQRGGNLSSGVRLFGFPEWQSVSDEFTRQLEAYKTTIYTTFFFDNDAPENKRFDKNYRLWYGHSISDTYPKYSVLGYDVAQFFLKSVALYGKDLTRSLYLIPTDGLQSNFIFKNMGKNKSRSNVSLFFVTFESGGRATRKSVSW